MKHFPIYVNLSDQSVVVSGGGEAALAKLRLLMKTEAQITVITDSPAAEIITWAQDGKLQIIQRPVQTGDAAGARLFYAANEDDAEDARVCAIATADGALVNWVDNLQNSQFITPAIVDRSPVTIAIGTEGAAPVLARAIKRDIEERLPARLGTLATIGKAFRDMANALPFGRARRDFWSDYYFKAGPKALANDGENGVQAALEDLLQQHSRGTARQGHVDFVGAGPGDPELLTLKARRVLHEADVVLYDRLASADILELARREANLIDVGKTGFGPAMAQSDINDLIIKHTQTGAQVVRLKSGDPSIFGRLDEELNAIAAHDISYAIIPGISAASGGAAAIGRSLTQRGRNSSLRFITGHDINGFAEHDWRDLAQNGQVAAIYMGKRTARFMQGRLMMYGADPQTPISIVQNVSRKDQKIIASTIAQIANDTAALDGPAILILGLTPRKAAAKALHQFSQELA